ncbi:hypothetical protein E2C01_047965 [Portunus trituberculatus]|uniref:Uncharacterized protein n=1 Tax=Portunus trituberculatus TaxID=210409 RepID=A0A5B7GA96_PORTR|nr:hypothetical protein [Portunus trituberculatus]
MEQEQRPHTRPSSPRQWAGLSRCLLSMLILLGGNTPPIMSSRVRSGPLPRTPRVALSIS